MQKSNINQIANSSFLSQFLKPENHAELDKYISAIKNNRVSTFHALLPKQINLQDKQESFEKTLMHLAAFYNSPVSALYCFERGLKLQQIDKDGKNVFHVCAYTGHVDVLRVIRNSMKIKKIKQINQKYLQILYTYHYKRTDFKQGKLKMAISEARKSVLNKMQQQISSVYQKFIMSMLEDTYKFFMSKVKNTDQNCFHLACLNKYQKCINILQYMFKQLDNINLQIDNKELQLYRQVGGCFGQFQKIDPRFYENTVEIIEQSILPQRLHQIKQMIRKKTQENIQNILSTKDIQGHNPLYIASKNGYTAIINLLTKYQNIKSNNSQKENYIKIANNNLARSHIMDLCDASKEADSKNINFLLSCGEEINKKKTIFGIFPLLEAVKSFQNQRNIQPIRLLLLSGADINQQDTNGWTVLHHACQKGMKQVLAQVFRIWEEGKINKIMINALTNKSYHILHICALNNHSVLIQFLLTSNAAKKLQINSFAIDGDNCTILHHAARKGSLEALKKILQMVPKLIYEVDVRSNTALHYAAMNDQTSCIKYLLYFDSDYDKLQQMRNTKGKLAKDLTVNTKQFENIFTAARSGNVNVIRKLITENSALKKITTFEKNRTLLIISVIEQHLLLVKFLIQSGVDTSHRDKLQRTALDYIKEQQKACKSKQELVVIKNILALLIK